MKTCCSTDGVSCDFSLEGKCHEKEKHCLDEIKCGGSTFVMNDALCCSHDGVNCDLSIKDKCQDSIDRCAKCDNEFFIPDPSDFGSNMSIQNNKKLIAMMKKFMKEWSKDPDSIKTAQAIERLQKEVEKQVRKGKLDPSEGLAVLNQLNSFLQNGSTMTSTTVSLSSTA